MVRIRNQHLQSGLLRMLRQEDDHLSSGSNVSLGNIVKPTLKNLLTVFLVLFVGCILALIYLSST